MIQVFLESDSGVGKSMEQTQGLLTVEAFRLYLDHLKQDGILQLVPPVEGLNGKRAQAVLATLSEAWKRSGRKDVDLHSLVVGHLSTSEVDVLVVTLKDVLKDERDHLGGFFLVGQNERGWVLPSDSSGPVMTDDKPFLKETAPGGFEGWLLGVASAAVLIALTAWVAAKERRKGVASQWQTFSIAIFFGGLGLSFALFSTFFEMRAMRDWGRPELASALVAAALSVFAALGAQLFAGHPKRRFGVRIQPLANFVFAALFAYLAGAVAEPLVASGGEIFSILIGASVLIPYGLLGGPFFPNAMEEAAEKLHPKSMYLLWASFAAGASLGLYVGTSLSASAGFSAVFLAGVFVFAWVAIIGGLVRPFSLRKAGEGS
ncbi:MAG: anti-sigma factor antagonist [Bdellovibrionaceae bacterium]|nr:anti-sigma factor antagonist [Pseudobdellovibrionaceae bacterium]